MLPFLCRLVQELRPLSDLRGKISAVRTRRDLIYFEVFSRFLRAHANAAEVISAIRLWEPQRTVYYISEKELKRGHVILGHLNPPKKDSRQTKETAEKPSTALKTERSPPAECGSS